MVFKMHNPVHHVVLLLGIDRKEIILTAEDSCAQNIHHAII